MKKCAFMVSLGFVLIFGCNSPGTENEKNDGNEPMEKTEVVVDSIAEEMENTTKEIEKDVEELDQILKDL